MIFQYVIWLASWAKAECTLELLATNIILACMSRTMHMQRCVKFPVWGYGGRKVILIVVLIKGGSNKSTEGKGAVGLRTLSISGEASMCARRINSALEPTITNDTTKQTPVTENTYGPERSCVK